jgi:hypothetical protein
MLGYARLNGERVIILDLALDEVLVTQGAPSEMVWVKVVDLDQITWTIGA